MDITKIVEDLIAKAASDSSIITKLEKDPAGTIKSLIGQELSGDDLNKVVSEVKSGLGNVDASTLSKAADFAKDLFKK